MGKTFDIGGPDVVTYEQMLIEYARMRHLRHLILTVPFLTQRLPSYWLVFITSVDYSLARYLVDGLQGNVVCTEQAIHSLFPRRCLS